MADTRINALSTATSSASDDYVPIDGTTNGTRKLSAYSPSFGGNATVGGTLTTVGNPTFGTSGNTILTLGPTGALYTHYIRSATAGGAIQIQGDPATGNRWVSLGHVDNASSYTEGLKIDSNAIVRATGTTASTTTSSGALVVSGGVGVAGTGYFGDLLNITGTAGIYAQWKKTNATSASQSWTWLADNNGTLFLQAANDNFVGANSYLSFARSGTTPGTTTVHSTTASTSTSSGALVVSGGVGVAKEMYLGGGLLNVAKGGAGATIEINADSGFASKLAMQRAATNRWTLEVDSSDVLTLKSLGTTAALTMTGTTSAEFVGSIKTAAPSGGTAAAWKLGTVASVSPTSPNRTIEVDIGGTIYYIHAKTTNN